MKALQLIMLRTSQVRDSEQRHAQLNNEATHPRQNVNQEVFKLNVKIPVCREFKESAFLDVCKRVIVKAYP
eukprot:2128807-Amphidinium_carterae.1